MSVQDLERVHERLLADQEARVRRGTAPTRVQLEIELLVLIAARLMRLAGTAADEQVAPSALEDVTVMSWILALNGRGGSRLAEGTTLRGRQYSVCLRTRWSAQDLRDVALDYASQNLAEGIEWTLLDDGSGPPPLAFLNGERLRIVLHGLLPLVEELVACVVAGDLCAWGVRGKDDVPGSLDDKWHPSRLAGYVGAMCADLAGVCLVSSVLEV